MLFIFRLLFCDASCYLVSLIFAGVALQRKWQLLQRISWVLFYLHANWSVSEMRDWQVDRDFGGVVSAAE